ncbi:MAG: response regulator transcription factor [Thermoanaerobaculia bacterium]
MRAPAIGPAVVRETDVSDVVEELVRIASRKKSEGDVVLDVTLDGFRCVVMRDHPSTQLSPREIEIARMVAAGHPNKTIAAVLEISTWTVGTYLRRIFAKLGVSSRAAMVAKVERRINASTPPPFRSP